MVKTDLEERFITLSIQIATMSFTLVNVYVPLPFSSKLLSKLSLLLLSRPDGPLLYVGDFNAVLDPAVDRLGVVVDPITHLLIGCRYMALLNYGAGSIRMIVNILVTPIPSTPCLV